MAETKTLEQSMNDAVDNLPEDVTKDIPVEESPEKVETKAEVKQEDKFDVNTLDPDKLPQEVLDKLYNKFQPKLSQRANEVDRKQRELVDKQNQLFEKTIKALEAKEGATVAPDRQALLKEAIESGDIARVNELQMAPAIERLGAIESKLAIQNAYSQAVSMDPDIAKPEISAAISEAMNSDPRIQRLMAINNFEFAPLALTALSQSIKLQQAHATIADFSKNVDKIVQERFAKLVADKKEAAKKLGRSGSNAGTSVTSMRESSQAKSLDESMMDAFSKLESA